MTDYLSKKALTITFSVSQWGATAKDKKVTDKALADNHATSDAGKFTKNLLSGDALDPIQKLVGKARTYHREVTLPWKQDGERLLPATLYADYAQTMRGFESSFEALVGEFCSNYEQQVESLPRARGWSLGEHLHRVLGAVSSPCAGVLFSLMGRII